MVRALKAGQSVGLLPDQVPPEGLGEWAPFFGKRAYTMTLCTRLAAQTGATVLVAWGERLSWGRGYRVHVEPLSQDWSGNMPNAMQHLSRTLEATILKAPQQYLWGYARYKAPRGMNP